MSIIKFETSGYTYNNQPYVAQYAELDESHIHWPSAKWLAQIVTTRGIVKTIYANTPTFLTNEVLAWAGNRDEQFEIKVRQNYTELQFDIYTESIRLQTTESAKRQYRRYLILAKIDSVCRGILDSRIMCWQDFIK